MSASFHWPSRLAALFWIVVLAPAAALAQTTSEPGKGCQLTSRIPAARTPAGPGHADDAWLIKASEDVFVDCGSVKAYADEATKYTDEDIVHLTGNVVFEQEGLRIYADHAVIDLTTHNGTFYDAHGTAQTTQKKQPKDLFGGAEPDVMFWAQEISRTGPEQFEFRNGAFTSCLQATPRWSVNGSKGTFVHDKRVVFWNAVLRVKGVPVFYIPFIYYPVNKEGRSTGFLMPSLGRSTVGGFQLSNAFFWAINRSSDATFYHDFLKRAGNGVGGEYRFVSSQTTNGSGQVYVFNQKANTDVGQTGGRSYTFKGQFNAGLSKHYTLNGQANYFTSVTTQQLYQQNVFDATQRTRSINVALNGGYGRYRIGATYSLNDIFNGLTTPAQRRGYAPRLTLSMGEAPIGRSRLYFGANAEAAYLLNQTDVTNAATNNSLARFDAMPTVRWPMSTLSYLNVTTSASWRLTEWLASLDPSTNTQVSQPLFRQLFGAETRIVGPMFARVWQPKTGHVDRVKHLIEPSLNIQWYSPYHNLPRIVQNDGTDYIVGGTTTTTYGITNRLLVRPRAASGSSTPGPVREVLSVDVQQNHFTNALAAAGDMSSPFPCNSGAFSAIQVTATGRPNDRISGQFRTDINMRLRTPCTLNASAGLNLKSVQLSAGWTKKQFIPGLVNFDDPAQADHFVNASASLKRQDGRLGANYAMNYDVHHAVLVQQNVVFFYNSQCCGFSVQYLTRDLSSIPGATVKSNHQFGVSFTLAGIGSFSNPLGSFK